MGQADDPALERRSRTDRRGLAVLSLLSSGGFSIVSFGGGLVGFMVLGVLDVFGPSGRPAPRTTSAARRTSGDHRPLAVRGRGRAAPAGPRGRQPRAAMPLWIGPRGAIEEFVAEFAGYQVALLWPATDLLVGVGAPAAPVAVEVEAVRRTRGVLRGTTYTLALAGGEGRQGRHLPQASERRGPRPGRLGNVRVRCG
ncbi:hypothetical protein C1J01_07500 [Nonomuraea aridisoli]|uniref:Uncharacterized protein n=1 Tax=Nonomuraea aridisoli TaxID=2070368 RepID=A0A2W2FHG7_9ACTN|nr:hypothetical protein C1J01_07500 [Nonomuraea aridisoli]